MLIPMQWIGLFATVTVFVVMFALGLMLGREQFDMLVILEQISGELFVVILIARLARIYPPKHEETPRQ